MSDWLCKAECWVRPRHYNLDEPLMIPICFSAEGKFLVEQTWQAVPRIGDNLVLGDPGGCWKVCQVTWENNEGEIVAQVELERLLGDLQTVERP